MDIGRSDARESLRSRWVAREGGRSLLYVSRALADCANEFEAADCFADGEGGAGDAGAGDAGPGDALVDGGPPEGGGPGGVFCRWLLEPPHCDMKDRTLFGRPMVGTNG
jgi:hypothetical protein